MFMVALRKYVIAILCCMIIIIIFNTMKKTAKKVYILWYIDVVTLNLIKINDENRKFSNVHTFKVSIQNTCEILV